MGRYINKREHIFIRQDKRPKGLRQIIGVYSRKWLIHPVKRRLARYYLKILKSLFRTKVIGITGSVGKTATKEMLVSILSLHGETIGSIANIDPVYNIPTTILKCRPTTKYLILEMGVEFPGEMDFYLWLAKPDVGVITNIYPTHTEFFGDDNGVFKEKRKLVEELSKESVAVLNRSDKFLKRLENNLKAKIVWFGDSSEFKSSREKITPDYKTEFVLTIGSKPQRGFRIKLPIFGYHFVGSALAASSVAHYLGIPQDLIKNGLENFKPPPHRMRIIRHKSGAIIVDDSYNSSPAAAKEAIDNLEQLRGEKIIVFGDMLELGHLERKYHKELGIYIGRSKPSQLICVGKAAKITGEYALKILGAERTHFTDKWEDALTILTPMLKAGTIILVKGSRSMALNNLVTSLS